MVWPDYLTGQRLYVDGALKSPTRKDWNFIGVTAEYNESTGMWDITVSGDVTGPGGSTANNLAVFADTSGNALDDIGIPGLDVAALLGTPATNASTSYQFAVGDTFLETAFTAGTAVTATVPDNTSEPIPVGRRIRFSQFGAGQVTVAAGGGVTIRSAESLKLRKQYSCGELLKIDTNEWILRGDLELA